MATALQIIKQKIQSDPNGGLIYFDEDGFPFRQSTSQLDIRVYRYLTTLENAKNLQKIRSRGK
jgi:hypothetical protein